MTILSQSSTLLTQYLPVTSQKVITDNLQEAKAAIFIASPAYYRASCTVMLH